MKKIFLLSLIFYILSIANISVAKEKSKIFDKKDLIITTITLINPVITVGTIISNANTINKILSLGSIVYTSKKGESITESALSQSLNKKCLIKNIGEKKRFCI